MDLLGKEREAKPAKAVGVLPLGQQQACRAESASCWFRISYEDSHSTELEAI